MIKTPENRYLPDSEPLYLDYNASTPVDPLVLESMLPYFSKHFANPSSISHEQGILAERSVENSRKIVADYFSISSEEIIFNSGCTEGNNTVLFGVLEALLPAKNHIITTRIEHSATYNTALYLQQKGISVTFLPVDGKGFINPDDLKKAITSKTALISIIAANNEIGTVQNLPEISKLSGESGILLHYDCSQIIGKFPFSLQNSPADFITFSSHKIYGPKGCGVLIKNKDITQSKFKPIFHGGGQEMGLRPGTLNVPGIVGTGKAIEILKDRQIIEIEEQKELILMLRNGIFSQITNAYLNGCEIQRICNNLNICIVGLPSTRLFQETKRYLALSSASACSGNSNEPSRVLLALGRSRDEAISSFRIGIGRTTSKSDIEFTIEVIVKSVQKILGNS